MKKNELFGLKNMFLSNNIASVGVKISCPHTEGVFYCSSYTTQTQTRAVYIILFQYCQSQLDEVKVGFDLYCCAELSEKKLLSWLDKYGQTESRVFYPRMSLYVINRHDPGSVNRDRQARSQTKNTRNNIFLLEKNIRKMKKNMVKQLENLDAKIAAVTSPSILPTPLSPAKLKIPPKRKKNSLLNRFTKFGKTFLDKLNII